MQWPRTDFERMTRLIQSFLCTFYSNVFRWFFFQQGEHKLIENENGPCNYTSKYILLANRSGIFTCTADNEYGKSATLTRTLLVHDLAEEFVIIDTKEVHINGDMASVTCGLASYKYSEFDWYVEDTLIDDSTCKLFLIFGS